MNKDELRKIYLTRRLTLTESEYREHSVKISDLFFSSVDLSRIHTLHLYLPIESKHEPDTWLIIERIRLGFPHIRLVIPRVKGDEMENIFFAGHDQLERTKWGMLEPTQGAHADPQNIDMVLVPLLAVDNQGHRIGYGKGYYDRFLKLCRPDCIKIGVSFFEPEQSIAEKSNHDVLLNFCLTPFRMYQFQN
jgi:5-formyltetrahydrofolate cyclo-ligase